MRGNPGEVATLVADLMISVTGFFRDAEAWLMLSDLVIAPLVTGRQNGTPLRIWVPACSTGEEAYSIAMLVTEQAEAVGKRFDLKVFATDAQEENLRKARNGIYPAAALSGPPRERLRRFFEEVDGSFQVTKELRDMVMFAPQNLLRDPPFSRLDLVSCRNFLIYLEPGAQQKIIALCHFGLRQRGHLFLGNAETIGRHDDLSRRSRKNGGYIAASALHGMTSLTIRHPAAQPDRACQMNCRRLRSRRPQPSWRGGRCWSATHPHLS
jgi:two-component system CheB/CheR fusion protein